MEETPEEPTNEEKIELLTRKARHLLSVWTICVVLLLLVLMAPKTMEQLFTGFPENTVASDTVVVEDIDKIENGIHVASGLIAEDGYKLVYGSCSGCHSLKLVTQNRATREGWLEMIRWMQETQDLPDLEEREGPILDYLGKYYAPEKKGRRENLENIAWYELE